MADDDIILSELSDEELVQQMHDDLYDGLKEEIEEATNILLERGWTPYDILTQALVEGMRIVGIDFRDGILFVPEVLLSANAMKAGMTILRPLLVETGAPKLGKMVIGTVKGDIHDIGKNLVGMMMEGAGFDVIDLGINNPVENYLDAIEREKPDILGMSALLTTTMPYMKVVIDTMKEKGIRDDYVVLVGGAPLNEEFGRAVGADAYCRDAAEIVAVSQQHGLEHIDLHCLPAIWHAYPQKIVPGLRDAVARARQAGFGRIFFAYADCGTGGEIDRLCEEEGISRIPGPHCYAFFSGNSVFTQTADDDIFSFFLTDFLARQFRAFVVEPLGLDRHPDLKDLYFGNYRKLVYLSQERDEDLQLKAREAALFLGLDYEHRFTGYGDLAAAIRYA
eukprot:g7779.t1